MKKLLLVFLLSMCAFPSFGQWIQKIPDSTIIVDFFEISFVDNNFGIVTGADLWSFKTDDGGVNWANTGWYHRVLKFLDHNTAWACSYLPNGRNFYKTDNGGSNWYLQLDSAVYDFPVKIFVLDPMHIWILGGDFPFGSSPSSYLYHTTTGGTNWNLVNCMLGQPFDIVFTDSLNGWMVGGFFPDSLNFYSVVHTHDGGITWTGQLDVTSVPGSENDLLRSVCFSDSLNGWIAGGMSPYSIDTCGNIYHTSDGGITWQKQLEDTIPSLNGIKFIDNNNGWAVGEQGSILHTIDGGNNWNYQNSYTSLGLNDINFTDSNHGWICGDSSIILYTLNGGLSGTENYYPENDCFTVFPNPVSGKATIVLMLKLPQNVTVRLIDMIGRIKMTIAYGQKQDGQSNISLDFDNISAGMYLIEVITENVIMTKKVVIN